MICSFVELDQPLQDALDNINRKSTRRNVLDLAEKDLLSKRHERNEFRYDVANDRDDVRVEGFGASRLEQFKIDEVELVVFLRVANIEERDVVVEHVGRYVAVKEVFGKRNETSKDHVDRRVAVETVRVDHGLEAFANLGSL